MHTNFFNTKLIFVFLISCNFYIISDSTKKTEIIKADIIDFSGSMPIELEKFIKEVNELHTNKLIDNGFCNKLLLRGSYGKGKTTFARKIADATNSELIEINGSELVTDIVGSGSQKLEEVFKSAIEKTANENKRVVIFIDKVYFIANRYDSKKALKMHPHYASLKMLTGLMDKISTNPRIIFVGTMDQSMNFDQSFIDRFEKTNIIQINNPNGKMRKEIINFYIEKINRNKEFQLSEKTIVDLTKSTKGMNIKTIKEFVYAIHDNPSMPILKLLEEYKKKNKIIPKFIVPVVKQINLERPTIKATVQFGRLSDLDLAYI